ncbi:hypothetical protein BZL30_3544 [Mycobacterium kansasii]|uniref:Uncharacterized protein n=1 Tax=Mycobacterium kansasii TaxID=1768 RepID=A0A1V3XAA2_MYCKA|nr:hypothetical protein BZL30_3544 [Mycobacterium kansasii]
MVQRWLRPAAGRRGGGAVGVRALVFRSSLEYCSARDNRKGLRRYDTGLITNS